MTGIIQPAGGRLRPAQALSHGGRLPGGKQGHLLLPQSIAAEADLRLRNMSIFNLQPGGGGIPRQENLHAAHKQGEAQGVVFSRAVTAAQVKNAIPADDSGGIC